MFWIENDPLRNFSENLEEVGFPNLCSVILYIKYIFLKRLAFPSLVGILPSSSTFGKDIPILLSLFMWYYVWLEIGNTHTPQWGQWKLIVQLE